tara:strand:- start:579 stop:923 length:345 start_codon:yes stop_codon:yes gene_type:complete
MDKDLIKNMIRESLLSEKKVESKSKEKEDSKDKEEDEQRSKWYTDVQNALDKDKNPTAPSQVGVMKSMGIPDDKKGVNRSLWGKKLHRDKNDEGGVYEFSFDELAQIRAILGMR